jgi:hypothetical protein
MDNGEIRSGRRGACFKGGKLKVCWLEVELDELDPALDW